MKIELTKAELEAVRWAVGNFEMGDASDCDGKARHKAMREAYAKLNKAFQSARCKTPNKWLEAINMSNNIRLNELAAIIHRLNHKWWHDKAGQRLQRNKGELLCLIHSEISEAMEGERKDLMDDKLPHRKMAEVELADALIRILDYADGFGYDIGGAVCEKLEYNSTREDHKHEAREQANGKKW